MSQPKRFQDRVAVVTGSSKGIGFACAELLAQDGAAVILNGRKPDELNAAVKKLTDRGLRAVGVVADQEAEDTPDRLMQSAIDHFGRIDYLVASIGVSDSKGRPHLADRKMFERTMLLNTWVPVALVQAAMKAGIAKHHGSIVTISSGSARRPMLIAAPYGASKIALESLTGQLARDLGPDGVRVNCVSPGFTRTDMTRAMWDNGMEEKQIPLIPLRRMGEPIDVARAVAFLLSDDASFISGVVLDVDGGHHREPTEFFLPTAMIKKAGM